MLRDTWQLAQVQHSDKRFAFQDKQLRTQLCSVAFGRNSRQ